MQSSRSLSFVLFLVVFGVPHPASAQTPNTDKSVYTLLNPTPKELWRPMAADRPDFTESPRTVDAGAVQLEFSFVDYAKNGDAETWTAAPVNLKVGLLNDVDIQFVFEPYVHLDDDSETRAGLGDTQVRLKMNFWGNDRGKSAFGFMPFIKAPTASNGLGNNHVEGGLIFPFTTDLTDDVGLGLMFETDFVFDEADDDYDTEFIASAVLGFDLTDEHSAYVEGVAIESTDPGVDFRGILGVGATYGVTENMVLDAGVNIGLTGDANDVNLFTGMTVRF